MNKKIFKSLFMGALLVGSVGTLTSCSKDYDNDINSLKDQIAKLATTEALNAKVTELQTSITTAKTTADAAKTTADAALKNAATNATDLATLKTSVNDLSTLVKSKADQTALDAAVANLNTLIAGKVDKSVYDAGVKALQDLVDANTANITKNTTAIEANKKAVDDKIAEIVAAIAKCASKDSLDAAVKKLEGQIGQRPTQEEVTKQITDAITAIKATLEEQFNNNLQEAKDNLITLIDKKASTDDLEAAKKVLQDEIDGAVARIGSLETAVGDLKGRVGTLEENLKNKVEIADFNTAISTLTESYNGLQKQIDALMNSIDTMVTSVELYTGSEKYDNKWGLDLQAYVEQETTFGPNGEVIFKKGTRRTTSDDILVRVSPTTANLAANVDSISLMNSQNQDLKEYLDITCVVPYTDLITSSRATATTSKNGLWKLTFKLKENLTDQQYEDFMNAVQQENGTKIDDVNFCVAVKSGIVGSNRAVVSSYEVTVNPGDLTPEARINFAANDKNVNLIHNRYSWTEDGAKSTKNIKELEWKPVQVNGINVQIPYTKENITADNTFGKTANAYLDNRQNENLLDVDVNTPITISFKKPVRAFYVTLDKDNAIESDPSEIAAWEKYGIDGLSTVHQDINGVSEATITIKDPAAKGDRIGFRVYAVNFDGTLQDPDGRAFYVNVLNREIVSDNTATVDSLGLSDGPNRVVTAAWSQRFNSISGNSAMKNFSGLVYAQTITRTDNNYNNPSIKLHFYNYKGEEITKLATQGYNDFSANELTSDEANSIDYIRYEMVSPKDWLDGETYNYSYTVTDNNNKILHIFNVKFTKSDLTADTKSIVKTQFQAKDKQVVVNEEGNKEFRAYMTPNVLDGATTGSILLNNAFDGLWTNTTPSKLMDANYKFTFTKSDGTTLTAVSPYEYTINKDLIDNKTSYPTTVDYLYKNYSYTMDDNGMAEYKDVPVTYSDFNTIFCCIFDKSVNSFDWVSGTKNSITYADATPYKLDTKTIQATNTYNGTLYGVTLDELLSGNAKYYLGGLKIDTDKGAHLYTKTGMVEDQYFTVAATKTELTFSPNPSAKVNPTADVPSTLVLNCIDSYGHAVKISLGFTVKKQ